MYWVRIWRRSSRWLLALCFIVPLLALLSLPGHAILVKEVPNPQKISNNWITDMADLISPANETVINQKLSQVKASKGVDILVVTVYDTAPSPTPKDFTQELFNSWSLQSQQQAVLLVIAKDEKYADITVGPGLNRQLSRRQINRLLSTQVAPQFENANFDAGILAAIAELTRILNPPFFLQPLPAMVFSGCVPPLLAMASLRYHIRRILRAQRMYPDAISGVGDLPYCLNDSSAKPLLARLAPKYFYQTVPAITSAQRKYRRAYVKQFGQARKTLCFVFLILFVIAITLLKNHVTEIWGIGLFYGGELTLWGWLGYEMIRGHRITEFIDAMAKLLLLTVMVAMLLMFFALSGFVEVIVLSIVSTIYAGITYIWLGTLCGVAVYTAI